MSRRFKPKWALAFFYFRQRRFDRFWPAAGVAVNVEAYDASQHALTGYAAFLLARQGVAGLSGVAQRIQRTPESRPLLLTIADRLIAENRSGEAVPLWNQLNAGRGIRPLSPAAGKSLSDDLFATGEGRGFEWRHSGNEGIELRAGIPGDLRIEFSGRQAESATLLEQFVPVLPGRAYRLSFHYDAGG